MALTKYKIGTLIELILDINNELKYGIDDARGMTITKEIIPTKANLDGTDLSKFIIVEPKGFIYNPRTHGKKIGFGYNNSNTTFIISWNNIAFKVKEKMKATILPDYLFLHFKRDEWDREACYQSWGTSTEVFTWDALCDMEILLPPLSIQQKYVDVYNAMIANQQSYERGLEDLKLVCDVYIDKLKHSKGRVPIRKFIQQIDNRNTSNEPYLFKGLSMDNYFIDSIANANGLDFSNYKIVEPNEYGAVLMKVGRDGRLTIARNDSNENYLISPAYFTFKTIGINSEYFMANVNRLEFERRGWFSCDASARGSLSWEEFMDLTIPDADEREQQIISELYRAQITRSEINEKLKSQIKDICPILIKGSVEEGKKSKET